MMPIDYHNPNDMWMSCHDPYRGMNDEERIKAGCLHGFLFLVAILFLLGIVAVCSMLFG